VNLNGVISSGIPGGYFFRSISAPSVRQVDFTCSHAKRGFEITLRPHHYKVFVEGSVEALFTKRPPR
jgi:hypothetical protein